MEAELSEWSWGDLEMPNHGTGTIVHICDMLDRVLWAFVACMLYRGDREAGRGTELKHTHFTTPPLPPPHSHSHSLSAIWRRPSLLSKILSFFPYRKHAGRRGGGEKKKKNASEATRERERKQRKLVVEREGEERGVDQMEGRKERISPRAQVRD